MRSLQEINSNEPDAMVAVATFAKVEAEVAVVPGAEVAAAAAEPELAAERGKKGEE